MKDKELQEFQDFIKSHNHLLGKANKEFSAEKIMFQLAYEYGQDSSVSTQAEQYFKQERVSWPWIRQLNRRKSSFNKLVDLSVYEHTDLGPQ